METAGILLAKAIVGAVVVMYTPCPSDLLLAADVTTDPGSQVAECASWISSSLFAAGFGVLDLLGVSWVFPVLLLPAFIGVNAILGGDFRGFSVSDIGGLFDMVELVIGRYSLCSLNRTIITRQSCCYSALDSYEAATFTCSMR